MHQTHHTGLTHEQVATLRGQYGFNEVIETTTPVWLHVFKKCVSPIPLMIEFALALSVLVGRWEDASIIAVLLAVNIGVDLLQERKATRALSALTEAMAPTTEVVRDGELRVIPARELVPTDVIKLSIGDIIPADVTVLDDVTLVVDQSTITGESLPVEVRKGGVVPASAVLHKGVGFAVVKATGSRTTIGESAALVAEAEQYTGSHFQTAIIKIGRFLIALSVLVVVLCSAYLVWRGDALLETVRFAIVLTIASIPVALPAVLSVTMAVGARALAERKAIVSDFTAVEELAGVDHLCIDKTGTLTENNIKAFAPILYNRYSEADLCLFVSATLEEGGLSPIEKAIRTYIAHSEQPDVFNAYTIESFIPFDPERKTSEAIISYQNKRFSVVMGASQVVASMVGELGSLEKDVRDHAAQGFRTIAVAVRDLSGKDYRLVGLIPLMDPPRDDAADSVAAVQERGVVVKMLTGDNQAIATFIASRLGIGSRVATSKDLANTTQAAVLIDQHDVFSEVVPADKFHIVESLQKENHIVAMTGDGVNDAPALKKADVGIAVKGATAAARQAADLVLLDSNLSVIREAIDQARQTFQRMQSYATFRISETIRIVLFVALSVVVFDYSPVSAVMIILLALLNDIPVLAISYDNVPLADEPVRWRMKEMLIVASVLGGAGLVSSFLLLSFLEIKGVTLAVIQTIIFLKLDVAGHSTLYLTRTGAKHFWQRPFPALKFFLPAFSSRIAGTLIAYFGIFMAPLSLSTIGLVWLYATVWFVFNDFVKVTVYKILNRTPSQKDTLA